MLHQLSAIVAVGTDSEWLSSQKRILELSPVIIECIPCVNVREVVKVLTERDCSAVIIDYLMDEAIKLAQSVRSQHPMLPILFIASQPFETGERFSDDDGIAAVILDTFDQDELDPLDAPASLKAKIVRAVEALLIRRRLRESPPHRLFVEVSIKSGRLGFRVTSEAGELVPEKTTYWSGRKKLNADANAFRNWALYRGDSSPKRLADDWRSHLYATGERLLN